MKEWPEAIALAAASAATICFQVILIQLLATVVWYHFAYLVISIALLGFGLSGTLLATRRLGRVIADRGSISILAGLCALSMIGANSLMSTGLLELNSYTVFADPTESLELLAIQIILAVPFTAGALVIASILLRRPAHAGKTYAINLGSSALGGTIAPLLLSAMEPGEALLIPAALAGLSGLVTIRQTGRRGRIFYSLALASAFALALLPLRVHPSPHKDLARLMMLPEAQITTTEPSAHGVFQTVTSPALRLTVPLSLDYPGSLPLTQAVCINGDLRHSLIPSDHDSRDLINHTPEGILPALVPPGQVWLFEPETTLAVSTWLESTQHPLTVTIEHPLLRFRLQHLAEGARVIGARPRAFLQAEEDRASFIRLPSPGSLSGTVGLEALSEQPIFTIEGVADAWNRLDQGGYLAVTVAIDHPLRAAPRLLGTLQQGLERAGEPSPDKTVVGLRTWSTLTFLVRRGGFNDEILGILAGFAENRGFDLMAAPAMGIPPTAPVHSVTDPSAPGPTHRLFEHWNAGTPLPGMFRTEPATDNRPYFSQFLRLGQVPEMVRSVGFRTMIYTEPGLPLVLATLIEMLLFATVLILLPLLARSRDRSPFGITGRTFVCAAGLGLGFITAEVGMIRHSIFFTGNPVTAAAIVLTLLLVSAGAGSWFCHRHPRLIPGPTRPAAVLALGFAFLAAVSSLPVDLPATVHLLISSAITVPAGFFMGMPFPKLIARLGRQSPALLPWAWGVNGYFSVIGAPLAVLILITSGFGYLSVTTAVAYAAAAVATLGLSGPR